MQMTVIEPLPRDAAQQLQGELNANVFRGRLALQSTQPIQPIADAYGVVGGVNHERALFEKINQISCSRPTENHFISLSALSAAC